MFFKISIRVFRIVSSSSSISSSPLSWLLPSQTRTEGGGAGVADEEEQYKSMSWIREAGMRRTWKKMRRKERRRKEKCNRKGNWRRRKEGEIEGGGRRNGWRRKQHWRRGRRNGGGGFGNGRGKGEIGKDLWEKGKEEEEEEGEIKEEGDTVGGEV